MTASERGMMQLARLYDTPCGCLGLPYDQAQAAYWRGRRAQLRAQVFDPSNAQH
jgi:hypothetical protein